MIKHNRNVCFIDLSLIFIVLCSESLSKREIQSNPSQSIIHTGTSEQFMFHWVSHKEEHPSFWKVIVFHISFYQPSFLFLPLFEITNIVCFPVNEWVVGCHAHIGSEDRCGGLSCCSLKPWHVEWGLKGRWRKGLIGVDCWMVWNSTFYD